MRRSIAALLCLAASVTACGSKGSSNGPTGPGPTPAIALAVAPGAATVTQGNSTPVAATLTRSGGFTGDVSLTVDGAPAGVTGSVSNVTTAGGTTSATVTIAVAAQAAAGAYNLTVRGTGTGVSAATAPFVLTVVEAPDFTVAVTPTAATVIQGQSSAAIPIALSRVNFTDGVTLALGGTVPAGVTASFSPPVPTGPTASMTLTVAGSTAPGVYDLSITGTGTPGTRSAAFRLTVTAQPSFALAIGPAGPVNLVQGTPDNSKTITIARTNYGGNITLAAEGLPAGMTATFAPNPATENSAVLTLAASGAVAPGNYLITIRGIGAAALRADPVLAGLEATTTVSVTVAAPPGSFSLGLALTCSSITIQQGGFDDSRVVTITRSNFGFPIALSVEGLPEGLSASIAPSPASGNSARLTLTANATVAPGTYPLTIKGTGPALLRANGGLLALDASILFNVTVAAGDAATPDVLTYDFATGLMGWAPGASCLDQNQPDWGQVVVQEQMFVLNGRGPAGNAGVPNAWVSKVLNIPANATALQFDAAAHFFTGVDSRLTARVLDGGVSTVIFDRVLVSPANSRVFSTYFAELTPWAGKTVRIFFEQDDNGFPTGAYPGSHEQVWMDNIRVIAGIPPVVTASCPGPRSQQTGGGSTKRFAQTFTAQHSGIITRATMEISGNPAGGDFLIAIRGTDGAGKPVGPVLASALVANVAPSNLVQDRTLDAIFPAPAAVTIGQKYAVSVEPTGGQVYYVNGRLLTGACSAGQRFSDPASNEGWVLSSADPLLYSIVVVPLP